MKFTAIFKKLAFVTIVFLIVITTQFCLINFQNPTAQAATISNQDTEFKELINETYAAWNTNNPENLAKFYAKDAELKFYDALPLQYEGWADYQTGIQKNLFDKMPKFKLQAKDDIQTHRQDNLAWTTFTWHLSAELKDGTPVETDGRQTDIWEKRNGKWLIVHEHISAPVSL
ncbi:MAG: DUF4440 domain-containing protein [Cyanobacteria bacterium J06635_10]